MSPLDAVVVEAVYEACRQEAIDSGRPIVPELFQQRDEAFQVQFCRTMERLLAPDYAGTPEAEHESWIRAYEKMGWRYGPERDPVAKTHPDMVPFGQLSEAERQKDAIFMACCSVARAALASVKEGAATGGGWVSESACIERVRSAYREGAYYGWTHGYSLDGCIQDARERSLIRYPLPDAALAPVKKEKV